MKGVVSFAEQQLGIELYPKQAEILSAWSESGKKKAVLCLGRRSGKGIMSAVTCIYDAVVPDLRGYLRQGELRYVVIVATKEQQAREHIRVIRELLRNAPDPDLAELVDANASTADEVVFRNGVVVRALPCSSRSIRGLAASCVVLDEFASFLTETEGPQAGQEILRAIVPSLAQFREHGRLLITSTPRYASGPFFEMYRRGESGADPDVFTVQAPTWEVNPHIRRSDLDGEFLGDPDGAAQEFGAQWVSGMGSFLDAVKVYQAVVEGRVVLPPAKDQETGELRHQYIAAADPAFARGGDWFGFAIMHRAGERYVLDVLRAWRGKDGPLNSDATLDEIAELCAAYGVPFVISDQHSAVPISDGLRRRNVTMKYQPLTAERKLDIFTSLKRALNLGQVELLDDNAATNELVHLELRTTPGGAPKIQAAMGHHDDRAMVIATALHELAAGTDPTKAKTLGSRGAGAEEWIALMREQAEAVKPEQPVITIRETKLGGF